MSELDLQGKFVALNGAPCTGKTTQLELLSGVTDAEILYGNESKHPDIISGKVFTQSESLDVENWFVAYHLGKLATVNAVPHGLVSDMSLQHDLVWARALLKGQQLDDFERTFHPIAARQLKPNISFLFLLPPGLLLKRIKARIKEDPDRQFESGTTVGFITRIQDAFKENKDVLADSTHLINLQKREGLSPQAIHKIILSELANAVFPACEPESTVNG